MRVCQRLHVVLNKIMWSTTATYVKKKNGNKVNTLAGGWRVVVPVSMCHEVASKRASLWQPQHHIRKLLVLKEIYLIESILRSQPTYIFFLCLVFYFVSVHFFNLVCISHLHLIDPILSLGIVNSSTQVMLATEQKVQ